jgi:hypothetical protein
LDVESVDSFSDVVRFQSNQDEADKHLIVQFYMDEVEDAVKTAEAGRPMFKSVEMCEIRVPGDKDCIIRDRVKSMSPDPKLRFPNQYARFQRGEKNQMEGTPLREWGFISRASAKGYEAANIYTVEQLAGLSDANAKQIFGSFADRQKAIDFIEQAKGNAPLTQARAEMEVMRQEIQALRDLVAEAGLKVPATKIEPPKRKPGRPKKVQEAS